MGDEEDAATLVVGEVGVGIQAEEGVVVDDMEEAEAILVEVEEALVEDEVGEEPTDIWDKLVC